MLQNGSPLDQGVGRQNQAIADPVSGFSSDFSSFASTRVGENPFDISIDGITGQDGVIEGHSDYRYGESEANQNEPRSVVNYPWMYSRTAISYNQTWGTPPTVPENSTFEASAAVSAGYSLEEMDPLDQGNVSWMDMMVTECGNAEPVTGSTNASRIASVWSPAENTTVSAFKVSLSLSPSDLGSRYVRAFLTTDIDEYATEYLSKWIVTARFWYQIVTDSDDYALYLPVSHSDAGVNSWQMNASTTYYLVMDRIEDGFLVNVDTTNELASGGWDILAWNSELLTWQGTSWALSIELFSEVQRQESQVTNGNADMELVMSEIGNHVFLAYYRDEDDSIPSAADSTDVILVEVIENPQGQVLTLSVPASAEYKDNVTICGNVTDSSGIGLVGVEVTIDHLENGGSEWVLLANVETITGGYYELFWASQTLNNVTIRARTMLCCVCSNVTFEKRSLTIHAPDDVSAVYAHQTGGTAAFDFTFQVLDQNGNPETDEYLTLWVSMTVLDDTSLLVVNETGHAEIHCVLDLPVGEYPGLFTLVLAENAHFQSNSTQTDGVVLKGAGTISGPTHLEIQEDNYYEFDWTLDDGGETPPVFDAFWKIEDLGGIEVCSGDETDLQQLILSFNGNLTVGEYTLFMEFDSANTTATDTVSIAVQHQRLVPLITITQEPCYGSAMILQIQTTAYNGSSVGGALTYVYAGLDPQALSLHEMRASDESGSLVCSIYIDADAGEIIYIRVEVPSQTVHGQFYIGDSTDEQTVVVKAVPELSVQASPGTPGHETVITASVVGASGEPTGFVEFSINGTIISTTSINGTLARYAGVLEETGATSIRASYVGDNNFEGQLDEIDVVFPRGEVVVTAADLRLMPGEEYELRVVLYWDTGLVVNRSADADLYFEIDGSPTFVGRSVADAGEFMWALCFNDPDVYTMRLIVLSDEAWTTASVEFGITVGLHIEMEVEENTEWCVSYQEGLQLDISLLPETGNLTVSTLHVGLYDFFGLLIGTSQLDVIDWNASSLFGQELLPGDYSLRITIDDDWNLIYEPLILEFSILPLELDAVLSESSMLPGTREFQVDLTLAENGSRPSLLVFARFPEEDRYIYAVDGVLLFTIQADETGEIPIQLLSDDPRFTLDIVVIVYVTTTLVEVQIQANSDGSVDEELTITLTISGDLSSNSASLIVTFNGSNEVIFEFSLDANHSVVFVPLNHGTYQLSCEADLPNGHGFNCNVHTVQIERRQSYMDLEVIDDELHVQLRNDGIPLGQMQLTVIHDGIVTQLETDNTGTLIIMLHALDVSHSIQITFEGDRQYSGCESFFDYVGAGAPTTSSETTETTVISTTTSSETTDLTTPMSTTNTGAITGTDDQEANDLSSDLKTGMTVGLLVVGCGGIAVMPRLSKAVKARKRRANDPLSIASGGG